MDCILSGSILKPANEKLANARGENRRARERLAIIDWTRQEEGVGRKQSEGMRGSRSRGDGRTY